VHTTATRTPKVQAPLPGHVAIIMDGNGRWAQQRKLPRHAGHRAGVEATRNVVEECVRRGIGVLTVFAFSSENWRRPQREVVFLMDLFVSSLQRQLQRLHENNVRLQIMGDRKAFPRKLREHIAHAEHLTCNNVGLRLVVAANYGGRWEITQAARRLGEQIEKGYLKASQITTDIVGRYLAFSDCPEPDLFIRTGGEQRISNFMLWQLAYTELYFTDILWPDFDERAFADALEAFAKRQRRFGRTGEQVERLQGRSK
jgi:undecaprenyl diphosphate synthase